VRQSNVILLITRWTDFKSLALTQHSIRIVVQNEIVDDLSCSHFAVSPLLPVRSPLVLRDGKEKEIELQSKLKRSEQ
jgi:hypothetical protein